MNKKAVYQASFYVALSGILYGFMGYLGTGILREHFAISTMLFWRFFVAGTWMLFFVMKKYSQGTQIHFNKEILFFMFILGAIGYAGSSGFYFEATRYTGTGIAMVIFFSYPLLVALASWIFHKNFSWITLLILIAMTAGLILLRGPQGHSLSWAGILFAVLSAVCYALYMVGTKKFSLAATDSSLLAVVVCYGCSVTFLLFALHYHEFSFPVSLKPALYLCALGILATAIPIQLMLQGLKVISSMRASIISVLEPLMTVFVGIILLHESLSHAQILGTIIILSSAIFIQFQREL